jgi:hypothetical protein
VQGLGPVAKLRDALPMQMPLTEPQLVSHRPDIPRPAGKLADSVSEQVRLSPSHNVE